MGRHCNRIKAGYKKETFSFGYMLGICNSDGYLRKSGSGISIVKKKKQKLKQIIKTIP